MQTSEKNLKNSFMSWWNSIEMLSRIQTGLAIFVALVGLVTLTVKLRADHLKKQTDVRRAADRTALDDKLQEQTAKAIAATDALEARTRTKPLPDRLIAFLNTVDKSIVPAARKGATLFTIELLEESKLSELKALCREPEAEKYIRFRLTGVLSQIGGDTFKSAEFEISQDLAKYSQ